MQDKAVKRTHVLSTDKVLRNATILFENTASTVVANIDSIRNNLCNMSVCELSSEPFAIFECKRVGVEEGTKKGPQTIEKAKQGAYVARSVSSLQKVRLRNGRFNGVIEQANGKLQTEQYDKMLRKIINSPSSSDFPGFILTVGVVSNHGNWFSSNSQNKELRVLAQAYDWLLFLTDRGLSEFIEKLILNPTQSLKPVSEAFRASYQRGKKEKSIHQSQY